MNTTKGDSAKSRSAPAATAGRGSTRRTSRPNSTTLTAPKNGPTSHAAPARDPSASIAGPPAGNCP